MKSRRQLYCTNCKEGMPKQYVFQGVVICEKCFTIVSRCVERAKKEMEMLFLTYTDMLRVALVKGEMNFPVLPKGTRMPRSEMEAALQAAASRIGGDNAQGPPSQGEGDLHIMRGFEIGPDGEVQRRRHPETVRGRRDVREVPEVQEDRAAGRGGPAGTAQAPKGLGQDTGGVDG
jgi:hypothetical protein